MDEKSLRLGSFEVSEKFDQISQALATVQSEFPEPQKNRKNDFFGNKYADFKAVLDTIKPFLSKHGLFAGFSSSILAGDKVEVTLLILHTSNQYLKTSMHMNIGQTIKKPLRDIDKTIDVFDTDDANKTVSNVTKLARALLMLTFLQQAGDDTPNTIPTNNRFHPLVAKLQSLTTGKFKEQYNQVDKESKLYIETLLNGRFSDEEIEKNLPAWINFLEKKYGVFK